MNLFLGGRSEGKVLKTVREMSSPSSCTVLGCKGHTGAGLWGGFRGSPIVSCHPLPDCGLTKVQPHVGSCTSSHAVAPGSGQVTQNLARDCVLPKALGTCWTHSSTSLLFSFHGAGLFLCGGPLKCGARNKSMGAVVDGRQVFLA